MFWVADPFEDMVIAMKSLLKGKEKDTDMQNIAFNFVGYKDPLKAINRLQIKTSLYTVKMLCHIASQMRMTLENTNN